MFYKGNPKGNQSWIFIGKTDDEAEAPILWPPDGCESWTIKKVEHQRIDAFELWYKKTLESPLDCKEIIRVYPKGNQSWIFIGRTHAEAETPILWLHNVKNWLIWKDPDAGKD